MGNQSTKLLMPISIQEELLEMEREIAAAEREYQRWSKGMLHTRDGKVHITEEIDAPYWIERMEMVAARIATKNENAVHLIMRKDIGDAYGHLAHKLTPLGIVIWDVCREAVPMIEFAYPGCRRKERHAFEPTTTKVKCGQESELKAIFNPYITVLLRACQKAAPVWHWYSSSKPDPNDPDVIKAFEWLVRFVRRVCRSKRFKYIENNYTRVERKNRRSCCEYMASKFAIYARLLIMRVDLYITPDNKEWASTARAEKCIARFLRALREGRIVPDVKAWICKRENGFRRGIHFHILVAIDGHKHREAATYSRILGEAWEKRYSDGCGSYYNCWVRRTRYPLNCLGLLHVSDRRMLMGLREAIKYITKGDCQVQTGYKRNLWKGITRISWLAVKRGAPRKAKHDLSFVSEILGGG